MNIISVFPNQIEQTIVALDQRRIVCPADHPFFVKQSIEIVPASIIGDGSVGDIDCTGQYVRALRDGSGTIHNVVISWLNASGEFEHVFIPGGRQHGLFVRYGLFSNRIVVTVEEAAAALIRGSTGITTVAALYPSNLQAVCDEILLHRPGTEIIIAVDYQSGSPSQGCQIVRHATEIAARNGLKLAVSGTDRSFFELLHSEGHEAVVEQIDLAEVPARSELGSDIRVMSTVLDLPASRAQNGSSLMFDMVAAIQRHLIVPVSSAILMALWVIYTHLYHHFGIAPYLAITSPEKRCGKTNLLTLLSRLCRNPFATSNVSEAAIYRIVDQASCTLLIDEADTFMVNKAVMNGILNAGYKRKTGFVTRSGKNGIEKMSTFCPKAIAMIGEMSETLQDRSIQIRLERKSPDEKVKAIADEGPDELSLLRVRLLRWVADNEEAVAQANPSDLELGNDRAQDNAKPLLAVASVIGGAWLERARAAFEEHADTGDKTLSNGEWLLTDTARAFEESNRDKLLTKELLAFLNQQEEAPWSKFSRGRNMDARDLSRMFKRFGISPTQMRYGGGNVQVGRGYLLAHFTKAFARYVKPQSAQ